MRVFDSYASSLPPSPTPGHRVLLVNLGPADKALVDEAASLAVNAGQHVFLSGYTPLYSSPSPAAVRARDAGLVFYHGRTDPANIVSFFRQVRSREAEEKRP